MFTGIIEETGLIKAFERHGAGAWRLCIRAKLTLGNVALGDSIAVNGCCLTVVRFDAETLEFDVLEETRRLTSLERVGVGSTVNLERSLRFDGKVGGHFVTGHIDGVGQIEVLEQRGADFFLRVFCPQGTRYVVHKGSIALDGISLTVAEVTDTTLAVWLIPHTIEVTNLKTKKVGDPLNLEFDLLAKYVEKLTGTAAVRRVE